jgi:hypothetical protein
MRVITYDPSASSDPAACRALANYLLASLALVEAWIARTHHAHRTIRFRRCFNRDCRSGRRCLNATRSRAAAHAEATRRAAGSTARTFAAT